VRVEYRYTSYSGEDWGTGGFITVEPSTHTGTVGLAWHF
jgi:outer membrane immunogenic protein